MVGDYTALDITLESNLTVRMLQTILTPSLPSFMEIFKKEVDLALPVLVPNCKGTYTLKHPGLSSLVDPFE